MAHVHLHSRLPARRDFGRPAPSSRTAEPSRGGLAITKVPTAKRQLPPIRSRGLEPDRGYAAAARDHSAGNHDPASDGFASDEEPQLLRRNQGAQHTWQVCKAPRMDFESAECEWRMENVCHVRPALNLKAAAKFAWYTSRENAIVQF